MSNVCIVLLCGIPGSGKTTVAKLLMSFEVGNESVEKQIHKFQMFSACFDHLLPAAIEKHIIEEYGCGTEISKWKEYRGYIYKNVDKLLSKFTDHPPMTQSKNGDMQQGHCSSECDNLLEEKLNSLFESSVVQGRNLSYRSEDEKIIIIDDNMYYRSMRYEYYQLARHYKTGFCQVFCPCSVEEATVRNKQRNNQVLDETICKMAMKLEEPCASQNTWEKNTFTWVPSKHNIEDVFDFIVKSLAEPVENTREEQIKAREESRLICSSNLVHQADKILRQLVKESILSEKEKKNTTPNHLQELARKLNRTKTNILEKMKAGDADIPNQCLVTFELSNDTTMLEDFLVKEFKSEIVTKT